MTTPITRVVVRKLLAAIEAGLNGGCGKPVPGIMSLAGALGYALGVSTDRGRGCVAPALWALTTRLGDARWSSPKTRAAGLRTLALLQLGTGGGEFDELQFVSRVVNRAAGEIVRQLRRHPSSMMGLLALRGQYDPLGAASAADENFRCVACDLRVAACLRVPADTRAARRRDVAVATANIAIINAQAAWRLALAMRSREIDAYDDALAAAATAIRDFGEESEALYEAVGDAAFRAAVTGAPEASIRQEYVVDAAAAVAAYHQSLAEASASATGVRAAIAHANRARDGELAAFADAVSSILVAMRVPGVLWLDLLVGATEGDA